jgi:hypothetical protein
MTYGTPEFYAEQFADVLADVDGDRPEVGDAIVAGFLTAVNDWLTYHQVQVNAYTQLRERVRSALTV